MEMVILIKIVILLAIFVFIEKVNLLAIVILLTMQFYYA